MTDRFLYKDESYNIRGAAFDVYKQLGNKHKETVYQRAFALALKERGLRFNTEVKIPSGTISIPHHFA